MWGSPGTSIAPSRDQPASTRGHRRAPGGRPRGRRVQVRRAELRQLSVCARRWPGQGRRRSTRDHPRGRHGRNRCRDALSRQGCHGRRRDRAPLRRLLRRRQRRPDQGRSQAAVPDCRRRRRRLLLPSTSTMQPQPRCSRWTTTDQRSTTSSTTSPGRSTSGYPCSRAPSAFEPPHHFPVWLARLFAGEPAVIMGTEARGASNAKAKRELGWTLRYPSWRQGFAEVYAKRRPSTTPPIQAPARGVS